MRSSFGKAVNFTVGETNVLAAKPTTKAISGDISGDGKVNLLDFSVAAYWYKRPLPKDGTKVAADLNGDGKVDLIDLSIMAFHWTG